MLLPFRRVARVERRLEALSLQLQALEASHAQLRDAQAELAETRTHLAQTQARPAPEALGLKLCEHPAVGRAWGWRAPAGEGESADRGASYRRFEDAFRGCEELIRERQRVYLSLIDGRQPVLDIGCGRGELLDLLRDEGLTYAGVDHDEGMVARCREKGHRAVTLGDGLSHLASLPDGSQGVIAALQVIEHLSADSLERLLELSVQKLAPRGILIAETVNPHAPQALKHFWLDRTHHHPVFPEVALVLSRIAGFASAYVFHPGGSGETDRDRLAVGDYALVAERAG